MCDSISSVTSFTSPPESPPSDDSVDSKFIRINGRKVMGPPSYWTGPPPPVTCEVYVKRIPKDMSEMALLHLFQQFGEIYTFRLMVDFGDQNRGFAYVHFVHEEDASKCMDVLSHLYVKPHRKLLLDKSYDKCRFFVSNIAPDRSEADVRAALLELFPELSKVSLYKGHKEGDHRGFAFVDFPSHAAAIRAKKHTSTGRCRLFDHDVKVVWANPEPVASGETLQSVRTLFVRNVVPAVMNRDIYQIISQFVPRTEIQRVSRVRDLAFVDFFTRESAEVVLGKLNGVEIMEHTLEVSWGIPQNRPSQASKYVDHDATLRMKCVANDWLSPIYIYGRIFMTDQTQYVSVVMEPNGRNPMTAKGCVFIMQVSVRCADLQSRVAEVVELLIEINGQLPNIHYVVIVDDQEFHIVGQFTHLSTALFMKSHPIRNTSLAIHTGELYAMCVYTVQLLQCSRSELDSRYEHVINTNGAFLPIDHPQQQRCFGCINPMYRQQPPLGHGLQCVPLVLALCYTSSGCNVLATPVPETPTRLTEMLDGKGASGGRPHRIGYRHVTLSALSNAAVATNGAVFFA